MRAALTASVFSPRHFADFGSAEAVRKALMEGSHAQWQFTGAYAANALGLSDQVPAKIIIVTDGIPRKVALGKLTLVFRRAAPRNLLGAGRRAGLVIQALRYLKGSPEIEKHVTRLRRDLDSGTKKDLAALASKVPAWMKPLTLAISRQRSMALSNHERVGKALEVFNVGLCPFVEREFKATQGDTWFETANAIFGRNQLGKSAEAPQWDTASLLRVMWDAWNEVFGQTLGRAERSLVSELMEVRNKWAHQKPFSGDDAYRALDSMQRLLNAVAAPK
jgi:hypothetical protein